mmetsp:Transcript_15408/g.31155  ORF Transcript_15408/g.31155 Transcript_15408/m.31155 type:complete len:90 (-) Transcript_15408:2582-2851(-)
MLGRTALTASRVAVRRSAASAQPAAAAKGQRRTFIDYLTNYPDRVSGSAAERSGAEGVGSGRGWGRPGERVGRCQDATHTTNGFAVKKN